MKQHFKRLSSSSISNYFIVAVAAFLPFLNSLDGEFVFDDGPAIVTNGDVLGTSSLQDLLFHDFWGNDISLPGSHKSYRPLTTLSFRLTSRLFGLSPLPFHLGNVFLHSAVTCLVFWLAGRLKLKKYDCFAAAVLFAVHPVHCEAVSGIVGRADVLSTLFVLLGLFLWDRHESILLIGVLSTLALLSKETGLVLPVAIFLFDLFVRRQTISSRHLVLLTFFGTLAFLRISFTGSPSFSPADNPLPFEKDFFSRWATLLYLPLFHLQLLLYPKDLCFDWTMGSIPLVSSVLDPRFWLAVVFYPIFCLFLVDLYQKKDNINMFCVLFGILSFLPASNLFIYVGFLVAERILYLPSVPFSILAVYLLRDFCKKFNCSFSHLILAILVLLSARTFHGNEDWRTAENLYRNALRINPAKAYSNLGQVLASKGQTQEAIHAYEEALHYRNMADTWYNLGILQSELGNDTQAIRSYTTAIELRSSFAAAYLNLGVIFLKRKREIEAEETFTRCVGLEGKHLKNWRKHWEAQKACYLQRGNLRKKKGKYEEAREDYLAIIDDKDQFYPLVITALAETEAKINGKPEAIVRLENLLRSHSHHVPAIIFLARFYSDNGDVDKAEKVLRNSIQQLPQCIDCMSELGLLIADKVPKEAEDLLLKVSSISPKTAHFLNYGVILQKRGKLREAEIVYKEIIRKNPKNSLALENYKKLLKTRNNRISR